MIDFIYKRFCLKFREILYVPYNECRFKKCDILLYHNTFNEQLTITKPIIVKKQYTLLTNLSMNNDELFQLIKKNCRYDIRRAESDGVKVDFYEHYNYDFLKALKEIKQIYNNMFKAKKMRNRLNMSLIKNAMKIGCCTVCCSKVMHNSNILSVYHVYLKDNDNVLLVYSCSDIWKLSDKESVNIIGRMNKNLHWKAILYFKSKNNKNYEWGGISDPNNLNGIDKFKMEFGGQIKQFDNYIIANSFIGKLYVSMLKKL